MTRAISERAPMRRPSSSATAKPPCAATCTLSACSCISASWRNAHARVREEGFFDERIPEPLRAAPTRATEFDPDRRYADVRELRAAFCAAARACGYGAIVSKRMPHAALPRPAPPSGACARSFGRCGAKGAVRSACRLRRRARTVRILRLAAHSVRLPARCREGLEAGLGCARRGYSPRPRPPARVGGIPRAKAAFSEARRMLLEAKSRHARGAVRPHGTRRFAHPPRFCWSAASWPRSRRTSTMPRILCGFRVLEYLVVGASSIVFLAYALADKRPLYERFAHFPRFSWWRQAAFFALYALVRVRLALLVRMSRSSHRAVAARAKGHRGGEDAEAGRMGRIRYEKPRLPHAEDGAFGGAGAMRQGMPGMPSSHRRPGLARFRGQAAMRPFRPMVPRRKTRCRLCRSGSAVEHPIVSSA